MSLMNVAGQGNDHVKAPLSLLLVVAFAVPSVIIPPSMAAPEGSSSLTYTPTISDAAAFYIRLRMNDASQCMSWKWNVTMAPDGEPVPFIFSAAQGVDTLGVEGTEVETSMAGRNVERGWMVRAERRPQDGDGHFMVNASAGGLTFYESYSQTGYGHAADSSFVSVASAMCDLPSGSADILAPWLSLIGTARVSNATLKVDFWESYDSSTRSGVRGEARGAIVFAAESNRTFLMQAKDFTGLASYNGDPLGTGMGPRAAGVVLEKSIHAERGLIGGFAVTSWSSPHFESLSYTGPSGFLGVSSQTIPLSPAQWMTTFEGPAGDWKFQAQTYVAPMDYSSLYLWGADIDIK